MSQLGCLKAKPSHGHMAGGSCSTKLLRIAWHSSRLVTPVIMAFLFLQEFPPFFYNFHLVTVPSGLISVAR